MIQYEARGAVSEGEVLALEYEIGLSLPPDYRSWLRETDGAHVGTLGVQDGVVNSFVGVRDTDSGGGLAQVQRYRKEGFGAWVPPEFLIVSYGAGGVVCIKATGPGTGSVWWADFDLGDEIAPDDERTYDPVPEIMSRLADSWERFLTEFEPRPFTAEDQAEIDEIVARSR